jgi:hypothetical protein
MSPEQLAAVDQDAAFIDESLTNIVAAINQHGDADRSAQLTQLVWAMNALAQMSSRHLSLLAAGAILRLAETEKGH